MDKQGRSSRTLGTSILALSMIATCVVVGLALAPPASAAVGTQVASVSQPMGNTPGTATNAVAQCPAGTVLVGGGIRLGRATDTATPGNGLKVNGTIPSDSLGNPVANGATDPAFWNAVGGFGGQSEAGDQVSAFAMCTIGGPAHTVVAVASANAPTAAATATVTASCPGGTRLVGGGALGTPAGSPSFKPIGSFPSDAAGSMLPNGAGDPMWWTAVGSSGAAGPSNTTTAFAVCSTDATIHTQVVRTDSPGPTAASTFNTASASCPGTALFDGGVNADDSTGAVIQQGVHLRGSYPSDAAGNPVANGATNPTTWSGIVQAGGQAAPSTVTHVFALCAAALPPSADLSITNRGPSYQAWEGDKLPYTIRVANAGPSPATGLTVTDPLPQGVTFFSASSSQGTCTQASGTVICTVGSLPVGGSATVIVTVALQIGVSGVNGGNVNNAPSVRANEADPNLANNTYNASVIVFPYNPDPDLSILATSAPDPVPVGNPLTHTLGVANAGPRPATGVTVTDVLPDGVRLSSVSSTRGTCGQDSGTLRCEVGNLAVGASATITFVVVPTEAGPATNTATVSGNEVDSNLANNTASTTTRVIPRRHRPICRSRATAAAWRGCGRGSPAR
jgi:uncharacterized repeat protein (TIGR01451 family)